MLYLVNKHYDNQEIYEDHYVCDSTVGIYDSIKLAKEAIFKDYDRFKNTVESLDSGWITEVDESAKGPYGGALYQSMVYSCGFMVRMDCFESAKYFYSIHQVEMNERIEWTTEEPMLRLLFFANKSSPIVETIKLF